MRASAASAFEEGGVVRDVILGIKLLIQRGSKNRIKDLGHCSSRKANRVRREYVRYDATFHL